MLSPLGRAHSPLRGTTNGVLELMDRWGGILQNLSKQVDSVDPAMITAFVDQAMKDHPMIAHRV